MDADGDTYGDPSQSTQAQLPPSGYVSEGTDCDDTNAAINPDAAELCGDGIDNNCDGLIEGCPIPDTNQSMCYNSAGLTLNPCPSTGQDFSGQDACYTDNPPFYTRMDAYGEALADDATDWVMVRDNITGLTWEVKTDDGGIHDRDDTYTWDGAADVFIAQLNADQFGGNSDWRIPTIKELSSIVDYDAYGQTVDLNYFPNTMSFSFYWSSTAYAPSSSWAWPLYFGYDSDYGTSKSSSYYVRAVRGRQVSPLFLDNADGAVTDNATSLMWMQQTADANNDGVIDASDKMNWQEALSWCENLTWAGYSDWRLPNIKELHSLADHGNSNPAIDTSFFPGTISSYYWSSTTPAFQTINAWAVNFQVGSIDNDRDKSFTYNVRAVREAE